MMEQNLLRKKKLLLPHTSKTLFRYKLLFVSLIPPHYTTALNAFTFTLWKDTTRLPNKYFIKQSYLILAWFYHLKTTVCKINKKTTGGVNERFARFIILPSKRSHYTLLKAPMAHKKNSKEQFLFKFYFILATFKGFTEEGCLVPSCNAAVVLLFMIQQVFPLLGTNVLISKKVSVSFSYSDYLFFNYHLFSARLR